MVSPDVVVLLEITTAYESCSPTWEETIEMVDAALAGQEVPTVYQTFL